MKQLNLQQGYISPQTELIDILPESILCQSKQFGVSLEEMTENDYTFTF